MIEIYNNQKLLKRLKKSGNDTVKKRGRIVKVPNLKQTGFQRILEELIQN